MPDNFGAGFGKKPEAVEMVEEEPEQSPRITIPIYVLWLAALVVGPFILSGYLVACWYGFLTRTFGVPALDLGAALGLVGFIALAIGIYLVAARDWGD